MRELIDKILVEGILSSSEFDRQYEQMLKRGKSFKDDMLSAGREYEIKRKQEVCFDNIAEYSKQLVSLGNIINKSLSKDRDAKTALYLKTRIDMLSDRYYKLIYWIAFFDGITVK